MTVTMSYEVRLSKFQQECMNAFQLHHNTLVVAPSSSGKTFVTKLYLYKYFQQVFGKFLQMPKRFKVAFLFPYKSLAIQEYFEFQKWVEGSGIKVLLAVGGITLEKRDIEEANIIVATYEKFLFTFRNSKVLKKDLKILAIDEFHFIGSERGRAIEEIIIESQKMDKEPKLILLSSSIANPEEIADWLNAKLIIYDERPVPLDYKIELVSNFTTFFTDKLLDNKQSIVFCFSRSQAEALAESVANNLRREDDKSSPSILNYLNFSQKKELKVVLENSYIPPTLEKLIAKGIAYHHAGLNEVIRLLIEELFSTKQIKLIFSTSTLAAGINLPAERVYFLPPKKTTEVDNNLVFQTLGRAGRLGLVQSGEGVIVVPNKRLLERYKRKLFNIKQGLLVPIYAETVSYFGYYENLAKYLLVVMAENDGNIQADFNLLMSLISDTLWFHQNKDILLEGKNDLNIISALFSSIISSLAPSEVIEFYELYDKTLRISRGKMQILDLVKHGSRVRATIKERAKIFQVYISLTARRCSCQANYSNFLCRHQRFLLRSYPELQSFLTKYGIVDYLVQNGFIIRNKGSRLTLTKLGWLSVKYNLYPSEILEFLEFNAEIDNNTLGQYIHKIITGSSFFANERKANELGLMETMKLIRDLMSDAPIMEICEKYKVSDSTIEKWKEELEKMFNLFLELSHYQGRKNITQLFEKLVRKRAEKDEDNNLR